MIHMTCAEAEHMHDICRKTPYLSQMWKHSSRISVTCVETPHPWPMWEKLHLWHMWKQLGCDPCGKKLHLWHVWKQLGCDTCGNISPVTCVETPHLWHMWKHLISNTFINTSCNTCGNTSAMTHVETLHLRHKWEHDTYDPCGNTSSATRLETAHVWHVWKDLTCSVRLCLPRGHRAPRPAAPTRLADRESVGGRAGLQLTVSNRLDRIYRRGIFSKILFLELL